MERINREVMRTDIVQVFLNDDSLLRRVTAVLFELHDSKGQKSSRAGRHPG
ncbi:MULTISPECIES: hypothetical protein [unclassified Streptomyces]|uniref:hypothetical protein n=1 Tax=unclassified Streptomyces TaxID=2593676 RepID=UPI0027410413|nr:MULTISPECIES: hypothetical protein [unclassified Streptomyces]